MINKFKKGGLNTSILAKIQKLPKEQLQQIIQAFSQWALLKGVDIQLLLKDPNALEEALGQFMQELQQQQTKAARHGAKLNYLKSLKNKCAEDEELVYFKKGGSIDCGCIKKKKLGGMAPATKPDVVSKFKKQVNPDDTVHVKGKPYSLTNMDGSKADDRFPAYKGKIEQEDRESAKKGNKDAQKRQKKAEMLSAPKNGAKLKKVCGGSAVSKFKAKCGSKLKKHQLGGSLNGIPFMQKGDNLPTAPEAENRFRKNSYNTTKEGNRETTTITSQTFGYNRNWPYFRLPATILRIIEGGDTAFVETPEHHIFTKVLPRTALKSGNVYVKYNPKYDKNYSLHGQANTIFNYPINSLEYETLKRRFNTAWNLAK